MKAVIGLIIAWLVFFAVSSVAFLLTNPFDVDILLSVPVFVIPYVVFLAFCWKRKPWAYIASVVLGLILTLLTIVSIVFIQQTSSLDLLSGVIAAALNALIAFEGFKAYSELRSSAPLSSKTNSQKLTSER